MRETIFSTFDSVILFWFIYNKMYILDNMNSCFNTILLWPKKHCVSLPILLYFLYCNIITINANM